MSASLARTRSRIGGASPSFWSSSRYSCAALAESPRALNPSARRKRTAGLVGCSCSARFNTARALACALLLRRNLQTEIPIELRKTEEKFYVASELFGGVVQHFQGLLRLLVLQIIEEEILIRRQPVR